MPISEHIFPALTELPQSEQLQGQVKFCSSCDNPLSLDSSNTAFFLLDEEGTNEVANVCSKCREQFFPPRVSMSNESRGLCVDVDSEFSRRPIGNEASALHATRQILDNHPFGIDMDVDASPTSSSPSPESSESVVPYLRPPPTASPSVSYANKHAALNLTCDTALPPATVIQNRTRAPSSVVTPNPRNQDTASSSPDPLVDITRLRVRSQGHHCLYPGASFQGTQKSGRNSYDVNVTIVDVDFSSSFLCGYLRIRGLTDDWPELTTYFDAEIIGSRYGFLTQNWGANEQEDMTHWQRFAAFRRVKQDLKQPHLTMSDRDHGAVFMRWKERFLVPDHRVQDINGASFAGFYYVCVDFNPPQPATPSLRSGSQFMQPTRENDDGLTSMPPPSYPHSISKPESPIRTRRSSSNQKTSLTSPIGSRSSAPTATMSGFYFHQNSEPYQQLSLNHVPERTSSSFEFR